MIQLFVTIARCAIFASALSGVALAESRSVAAETGAAVESGAVLLAACVDAAPNDPRQCVGRIARACGAPETVGCIDAETAGWDAFSDQTAAALSTGHNADAALQTEAKADVLNHRAAVCTAMAGGDARKAALCRQSKAVDRAIVFHMLLSLEGGAR